MTVHIRCPYCGTRNDELATSCHACAARPQRRTNGLGWMMIGSLLLLPLYAALRWMAPEVVAPRRWRA